MGRPSDASVPTAGRHPDWVGDRVGPVKATRIVNPVGHRRVERARMNAIAAPGWHVIIPDNDDDWCCDGCSARLDPHAPIIAVGSYALCADEASDVLVSNDLVLADCQCPGCQEGPSG